MFPVLSKANRCDILVFIWCLNQMQGILYPTGVINFSLRLVITFWFIYEARQYVLPNKNNPFLLRCTSYLLLMFVIYGTMLMVFGGNVKDTSIGKVVFREGLSQYEYILNFLTSLLPIFVFYKYSREGVLTSRRLMMYLIPFMCVVFSRALTHYQTILDGRSKSQAVVNEAYIILSLVPYVYLLRKKVILQYAVMVILSLCVFLCMKRGAILVGAICFMFFIYNNIKASETIRRKKIALFFTFSLIIASTSFVLYSIDNNVAFQRRIKETSKGKVSGRDHLYSDVWNAIYNDDSIIHLFLGRGANGTLTVTYNYAHQDWLEIGCNNGLLGISVFFLFCCSILKTAIDTKKRLPYFMFCSFITAFIIFFSKTMFSMSIQNMPIYQTMLFGFFTAKLEDTKHVTNLFIHTQIQ